MTEITAQYLNVEETLVSRSDMPGASIPAVKGNRHWDELAELGVTPAPYVAPPAPPVMAVTARQARLALLQAGLLAHVEVAVAGSPDPAVAVEWEYATTIERDSPLVASIGGALGMTEQQIDGLFEAAASL